MIRFALALLAAGLATGSARAAVILTGIGTSSSTSAGGSVGISPGSRPSTASASAGYVGPFGFPTPLVVGVGYDLNASTNGSASGAGWSSITSASASGDLTIFNDHPTATRVTFDLAFPYSQATTVTDPASAVSGIGLQVADSVSGTILNFVNTVTGTNADSGTLLFPVFVDFAPGETRTLTFSVRSGTPTNSATGGAEEEAAYRGSIAGTVRVAAIGPTPVPEPATLAVFGALVGVGGVVARRQRRANA